MYDKGLSNYSNEADAKVEKDDQSIQTPDNGIRVYATTGAIIVEGAERKDIRIITIDGKMIYQSVAHVKHRIPMNTGFYIVLIDNTAVKVVVP